MKRLLVFIFLLLLVQPTSAQDTSPSSDAPYIYYYSNVLNGVVIERADGTDSRIVGQQMVENPLNAYTLESGGWSPSGRWLAFRTLQDYEYGSYPAEGYAVSTTGQTLSILNTFNCIYAMLWHHTEDMLFIMGKIGGSCSFYPLYDVMTYWIVDVTAQTILVNASMLVGGETSGIDLYWFDDAVRFIDADWILETFYDITLFFNGRVQIDTYSLDEITNAPAREGGTVDRRASGRREDEEGWYFTTSNPYDPQNEPQAQLSFEPPINSSGAGGAVSLLWHSARNWVFFGYEACFAGCAYVSRRVSMYQPHTGQYRELAACGINAACVGWLPERVPLDELPVGSASSVLPAPLYYQWGQRGLNILIPTHELICSEMPPFLSYNVRNLTTGLMDYLMPVEEPCRMRDDRNPNTRTYYQPYTPPVVFALSPNYLFYAITEDTYPKYTRVHDAITGERLAMLNFEGQSLAFSPDSTILYTDGRFANAAWSIEDLIGR